MHFSNFSRPRLHVPPSILLWKFVVVCLVKARFKVSVTGGFLTQPTCCFESFSAIKRCNRLGTHRWPVTGLIVLRSWWRSWKHGPWASCILPWFSLIHLVYLTQFICIYIYMYTCVSWKVYAYASGIHISKTKVLLISRGSRLLRCFWFAEYVFLVIDGSVVYIYTRYILYLFCCSLFLSFSRCNWYSIWCLQYFGWVGDLNAGYGSLACIKRLAFTVSYNSGQTSAFSNLPVWRNILVLEHPNSQHQGYSFFFLHLAFFRVTESAGERGVLFGKCLDSEHLRTADVMQLPLPIKFEIFEIFPTAQQINQMYCSSCHSWPAKNTPI